MGVSLARFAGGALATLEKGGGEVEYKIDHIPKNTPKSRRPAIKMAPKYLTIHSTGNERSTAKNERAWLTNAQNGVTASWHIVVDEKEAIEAIPLDEVAWHAGDGQGQGNKASIGIEICESGDRNKTLANAIRLTAKMLKERGWGVDRLRRHYDWSGKICPRILSANNWAGWDQFKRDVEKKLADDGKPDKWAEEAWAWAQERGLLDGTRPKDNITRQEIAIILQRLVGKKGSKTIFL